MSDIFDGDTTEGILLVVASKAINNFYRSVTLHNCQVLCPLHATVLINIYCGNANHFVAESQSFSKKEPPRETPIHGHVCS